MLAYRVAVLNAWFLNKMLSVDPCMDDCETQNTETGNRGMINVLCNLLDLCR